MSQALVIVESPTKAKTIGRYLGGRYRVAASMGHVRDLPRGELGVDIDAGFAPRYEILPEKQKVAGELGRAARNADGVYLALDRDREGEAIAWHIQELLGLPPDRVRRVVFNEITPRAIREAFERPGPIDARKVEAQQARRILDRIVGYKLSPLLWEKVLKGLSAGRVQSVAVKLVADREREIRAFQPREYWTIRVRLRARGGSTIDADLRTCDGRPAALATRDEAEAAARALRTAAARVAAVHTRERSEPPPPPFTTSRLQQDASTRLHLSPRRTMRIAQQLYEGVDVPGEGSVGLITYMRTDSVRICDEASAEAREAIRAQFGPPYLPDAPRRHAGRKGAQDAHEAIRPTSPARTPDSLAAALDADQARLYELIWRQLIASQMPPARYRTTRVEIRAGRFGLLASGRVTLFDGFRRVLPLDRPAVSELPALTEGDELAVVEVTPSQHFTQPPKRYSEASLIRTLEKEGIGRPSTYATILTTIQDRRYVELRNRRFYAADLGIFVTDRLARFFPELLDPRFTSELEAALDRIETGEADRLETLAGFWRTFSRDLDRAWAEMPSARDDPEPTGEVCPHCERPLVYVWTRSGRFLGCSGYPACSFSRSVDEEGRPIRDVPTEHTCERCGRSMVLRRGRNGAYLACTAYPSCAFTLSADPDGQPIRPPEGTSPCEKCGDSMVVKGGPHGPFLACARYPDCRNTRSLRGSLPAQPLPGQRCKKCGMPLAVRSGRRGRFVACTGYPRCRNTRPLRPDDLLSHPREGEEPVSTPPKAASAPVPRRVTGRRRAKGAKGRSRGSKRARARPKR